MSCVPLWVMAARLEEQQVGTHSKALPNTLTHAHMQHTHMQHTHMQHTHMQHTHMQHTRMQQTHNTHTHPSPSVTLPQVGTPKARTVLELARLKNPTSDELWLASVRLERRAGESKLAAALMAKALQACPNSGILWSDEIGHVPRPSQRAKAQDAMKKCENDPRVVVAVASLFWRDRKYQKARKWLNRAVTLGHDLGDSWAVYYQFELQQGDKEQQEAVLKRCVTADPHHGEEWCAVSKAQGNHRLGTAEVLKIVAAKVSPQGHGFIREGERMR